MRGNSPNKGFTLIELLIVLAIIGVMLSVVTPNIKKLLPRRQREAFISNLNALTKYAWQHALIERKVHKVIFDFKKKLISVQMATGKVENNQVQTAPIKRAYVKTSLTIPDNIDIKNFIVEGYDEKGRFGAEGTHESWFFIVPDGLTQMVTINYIDKKSSTPSGKPRQFGLVINPFTAQFINYDSFQK